MICDSLDNFHRYAKLSPEVWETLKSFIGTVTGDTPKGRYQLDGDMVMADVNFYKTAPAEAGRFENHRRYVDIQAVLSGHETIYLAGLDKLELTEDKYAEKDCGFYSCNLNDAVPVAMPEGSFMVIYPEEGHMPGRGNDNSGVCKIVFKVDRSLLA